MTAVTTDEAELREMIARWNHALEAKDAAGLVADYADDAVLFDVKPPGKVVGPSAIQKIWADCLPYFPERFVSEHKDLELVVGDDVAFAYGFHRIMGDENHRACMNWMRVSVAYRKIAGVWKVVHEHVSMPFDPRSGKVVSLTDADVA